MIDIDHTSPSLSPMDTSDPPLDGTGEGGERPLAVLCEDGSLLVNPELNNSPIRVGSFTRIADMAPKERAGFMNQFRSKGGGRASSRGRGQQLTFGQQKATSKMTGIWTARDAFDELIGQFVEWLCVLSLLCNMVQGIMEAKNRTIKGGVGVEGRSTINGKLEARKNDMSTMISNTLYLKLISCHAIS